MTDHPKVMVYVLLGGLFGNDGYVDSRGMLTLAHRINEMGVPTSVRPWSAYQTVEQEIRRHPDDVRIAIVGYSGGGSRATWIASDPRCNIDLLVAYDPSPPWQMKPLGKNVLKAVCYHNTMPLMFGLGGGVLVGHQVETVDIAEQHLAVQFDEHLHQRTLDAIKVLTA